MTKRPPLNHSPPFKAKVAIAATKGEDAGAAVRRSSDGAPSIDVKVLHAKSGELTLANDFLAALGKAGLLASARR